MIENLSIMPNANLRNVNSVKCLRFYAFKSNSLTVNIFILCFLTVNYVKLIRTYYIFKVVTEHLKYLMFSINFIYLCLFIYSYSSTICYVQHSFTYHEHCEILLFTVFYDRLQQDDLIWKYMNSMEISRECKCVSESLQ